MRLTNDSRLGINEPGRPDADEYENLPDYEKYKTIRLPSDYPQRVRLPSDDLADEGPTPFSDRAL